MTLRNEAKPRYRCPACHNKSEGLWEGVTVEGWRSINQYLEPEGSGGLDREADWHTAIRDGHVGCACGWEGRESDLELIGLDGELVPTVHPHQLSISAALPEKVS